MGSLPFPFPYFGGIFVAFAQEAIVSSLIVIPRAHFWGGVRLPATIGLAMFSILFEEH